MIASNVDRMHWDFGFLRSLGTEEETNYVEMLISLRNVKLKDRLIWKHDIIGGYSAGTCGKLLEQKLLLDEVAWQKKVWNNLVPTKMQVFLWIAVKEVLPTKSLSMRGIQLPDLECCWYFENETLNHTLLHCAWSWRLWNSLLKW